MIRESMRSTVGGMTLASSAMKPSARCMTALKSMMWVE